MRKIKENTIIDLRNQSEEEKSKIMAQISKKINDVFEEKEENQKESES